MTGFVPAGGIPVQPRKLAVLLAIVLLGMSSGASADNIEFNTDVLDVHDKANIDLSHFTRAGYIMPGGYMINLRVNKNEIAEQKITWLAPDNDPSGSVPCLTAALVDEIALKEGMRPKLTWFHHGQCLNLDSLPGAVARADLGKSMLYLSIPQAYLEYQNAEWDPPSRWDNGVPGLLLDYYASAQTNRTGQGSTSNTLNGNGTAGANFGPWRLRVDWQANVLRSRDKKAANWSWNRVYAYRAIPSLAAKLTLGEDSLFSDIFDSFLYTGVSLQTDDNMLPPNLRGYAPEVTGVARTNARVIISQHGQVLEETQVAAGPFRIQDLNDMVSGTLDVRVEELDGTVQTFSVNTANVPYLTRPGRVRYKLAAGKPSDMRHQTDGPPFATGEFSWGVNNGWSLYGGGVGSKDYDALALGIGRDLMAFGALSFDITHSRASLPLNLGIQQGNSYRLSYSKRFDSTNSQVTFAGYRFSERSFMSMSEFLAASHTGRREGSSKEMYTISLSQAIPSWGLSAYLNYNHQTYWDRPATNRYTFTLSRFFDLGQLRGLSLSLTAYRNRFESFADDGMYMSLSLPWGNDGTLSYSGTLSRDSNSHQLGYYGRLNERDSYQLNGGVSGSSGMASGSWSHSGDMAQLDANASYQAGGFSALSMSLSGGMTATLHGAALHRSGSRGGTRMLLDSSGVPGIPIRGYGGDTTTNLFGKAVSTDVGDYRRSQMNIDLDALPDNAEVPRSVIQATLTEGAIGYRKFDVVSGFRTMATLRLANGSYPPFGATVSNAEGQNTGIVGDEGSVYLSGINPGDRMQVQWEDNHQCELALPPSLPADLSQGLLLPCTVAASRPEKTEHQDSVTKQ